MSFYSYKNEGNQRCPGLLGAEGMSRCCERVCIQVNKVYDACLQQETKQGLVVDLKNIKPCGVHFTPPLTFLGCRSTTTTGILRNTKITRLEDRPNFARVETDVKIPIEVTFKDADGVEGSGTAKICVHKDVILYVPDESVIPFELDSVVSAVCVSGSFNDCECFSFTIDACVTIILKIIAKVELLIPAFGFCEIPPCEEFADNVCDEFFSLPLFPPQMEDVIRRRGRCCSEEE